MDLDYGVIFGFIVVQLFIFNLSCLIGLMIEDSRNDLSDIRLLVSVYICNLFYFFKCLNIINICGKC